MTTESLSLFVDGKLNHEVESFQFPDGQWHLKNTSVLDGADVVVIVRGTSVSDLLGAALVADCGVDKFTLLLPYLPGARMDRGRPFGAEVYADFVNAVQADQVVCVDPHSEVMPGMIRNLTALPPTDLAVRAVGETEVEYNAVIAPDKGAVPRAQAVAHALGVPLIEATKVRDFDTGRIQSVDIPATFPYRRALVVDDICDGGGTFMQLAQAWEKRWDGWTDMKLGLWVTHGVFSGSADKLREHYTHIMTTDSLQSAFRVGVATTIVPVFPYMTSQIQEIL